MPGKLPYFPFYPGDWLKDDCLTMCAPATRGIWIDLITRMHESDRSGELRGTPEQLSRAARCSTVELESAVTELSSTGTADVERRNSVVTIRNRRMYQENLQRKAAAERQLRYRSNLSTAACNGKKTESPEYEYEDVFEEFWKAYPAGRKKSKGKARESFGKAVAKVPAAVLIEAARHYAASDEGRGKFVKMPATWLNGECWNDDRAAWRDLDSKQPAASAKPEYRQVELRVLKQHKENGDFLVGPKWDKATGRVYGQLKSKAKIESNTNPGWTPNA